MSGRSSVVLDVEKGEAVARFGEEHRRMVLMATEAFVTMMETLNAFGSAGLTMFYAMGMGKGRYDVLRELEVLRQQGNPVTKDQFLENIVHHLRVTGWGATAIKRCDVRKGELIVVLSNNPFVPPRTEKEERRLESPLCHYFRGYWVGVASEVFESMVICTETKCMGKGDPYCEFEIVANKG